MNLYGRRTKLSTEQVADILSFLQAHKWRGARFAIARKHGIRMTTLRKVIKGEYQPAPPPFFEPAAGGER